MVYYHFILIISKRYEIKKYSIPDLQTGARERTCKREDERLNKISEEQFIQPRICAEASQIP